MGASDYWAKFRKSCTRTIHNSSRKMVHRRQIKDNLRQNPKKQAALKDEETRKLESTRRYQEVIE
jgi:hypothetical protein